MKPKLHFAHANGVPSPVYEPFLSVLRDQLEVAAITPLGATAGYPVDQNWKSLTSVSYTHLTLPTTPYV